MRAPSSRCAAAGSSGPRRGYCRPPGPPPADPSQPVPPLGPQTRAVHASRALNTTSAVVPPIWQTTTFKADTAEEFLALATAVHPAGFYTRYGNPNHEQVEATLASLEGAEA